jgi:hypothetical protein
MPEVCPTGLKFSTFLPLFFVWFDFDLPLYIVVFIFEFFHRALLHINNIVVYIFYFFLQCFVR